MKKKIVIEVSGGLVVAVYSSYGLPMNVEVVDWDNIDDEWHSKKCQKRMRVVEEDFTKLL